MLRPRETGGEMDLASFWRGVGAQERLELALEPGALVPTPAGIVRRCVA